jgi:glycosyltransferase involved in cell wall biosynthesis
LSPQHKTTIFAFIHKEMRVLLSAIACHPEWGSEGAVGWRAALAIAKTHEVHVLTSEENREGIERHVATTGVRNPTFTYIGKAAPYNENRLIARGQSWLRYLSWMSEVYPRARMLVLKQHFDVVHHVTYSTCRVASPLWKLGIPFVFGPVGGGERLPWVAASSMSSGQQLQEFLRFLDNASMPFSLKLRHSIGKSSVVIASNKATARKLRSLGANEQRLRLLPAVFFTREQIDGVRSRKKHYKDQGDSLSLFSSGMLEGRKGLGIALHAVRMARSLGLRVNFTVPSRGPEFAYLRELSHKLGISDIVHFPESLPREEYWAKLLASDVYMAPSLRDNCPATLLEAMLSRCVPVVANCNGPGEIVSQETGEVIEPARLEQMASDIAERLIRLARDKTGLRKKAEAASEYVARTFTEERYLRTIEEAYRTAVCKRAD